jgi:hypothetical protein
VQGCTLLCLAKKFFIVFIFLFNIIFFLKNNKIGIDKPMLARKQDLFELQYVPYGLFSKWSLAFAENKRLMSERKE